MSDPNSYDYIIVGAGAAGCVIAARLVERTGARVLLLEAGGPDDPGDPRRLDRARDVLAWGASSPYDWNYSTEPGDGVVGRRIAIAQGKVLGGGTSINAMMYIRGNRRDYDHRQAGQRGPGLRDVPCSGGRGRRGGRLSRKPAACSA
ncbi:MAG: GMC family oxidoreductase N-terminal domain-containing protein [Isosphaeraceae bacterium]